MIGGITVTDGAAIAVRKASLEDYPELVEVVGDSTEGLPPNARVQDRLDTLKAGLERAEFRVLLAEGAGTGHPVGYAVLRLIGAAASPISAGLVSDLFVTPSWRRRGVGRRLLGELIAMTKHEGYARVRLWVNMDHTIRRFYASIGFREQRVEMELDFGPGCDARLDVK